MSLAKKKESEIEQMLAEEFGVTGGSIHARVRWLVAECERLRKIIDSRPAINAGLPATYIEWSQGIYAADLAQRTGLQS